MCWISFVHCVSVHVWWSLQYHWKTGASALHDGFSTTVLIVTSLGQPIKTGGWARRRLGEFRGLGGGGQLCYLTQLVRTQAEKHTLTYISYMHAVVSMYWEYIYQQLIRNPGEIYSVCVKSPHKTFYMVRTLLKTWIEIKAQTGKRKQCSSNKASQRAV